MSKPPNIRGRRFRKYFEVSVDCFGKDIQVTEICEALIKAGIPVTSVTLKEVE